jgi:hypothetical protein
MVCPLGGANIRWLFACFRLAHGARRFAADVASLRRSESLPAILVEFLGSRGLGLLTPFYASLSCFA